MKNKWLTLLISLTFLINPILNPILNPIPARAECANETCIDVYVQDGKIVIDAKRAGVNSSPKPNSPIPKATRTYKPRTYKPTAKTATASSTKRATVVTKRTYKPRTSTPKPRESSPSLADRVLQSLPTLQVAYQPEGKVLPRVPVIFFTDLPTQFNKDFKILGVVVRINVKPRSLWSFGDGSTLLTSKPGRPYPTTDITHSYSVPGTYLVSVATIWSGSFTVAGITKEIPGVIRQVSAVDVKVVGASTKFVGK